MKKLITALSAISLLALAQSALAITYKYEIDNPPGSANAGDIKNVTTTFDTDTEVFTWSYTIGKDAMGNLSDGFWLVVTDGENPKNDTNEYAILYGDTDNSTVTAYEYSGQNNANSFNNPGVLLGSFGGLNAVDNANMTRTVSFSIDATGINTHASQVGNADWKGLLFGKKIGIWFHPSTGTNVTYTGDEIDTFTYSKQGWYDTGNQTTTIVPVPAALPLFATFLMGMGALSLRRKVRQS